MLLSLALLLPLGLLPGCATRSADVKPLQANPADFASWGCPRIDDELDRVQQRATDVAYAVDARIGNNILALGLGVTVFWPAILALRPDGPEATELAQLKGRYEALRQSARGKDCPPADPTLSAARAAALPVALGERLVYEERRDTQRSPVFTTLRVDALRRDGIDLVADPANPAGAAASGDGRIEHDLSGNVVHGPSGSLVWPRLLKGDLALGALVSGNVRVVGDPLLRARLRGQVMAVGPQMLAGRRFDAMVVELFGDAQQADLTTRLEGVIVVDRHSGVLLSLDLKSAVPAFSLQRRLLRIDPPLPAAAPRQGSLPAPHSPDTGGPHDARRR